MSQVKENSEKKKIEPKEIDLTDKQLTALNKTNETIKLHEYELDRAKKEQSQLLELILEFNDVKEPKSVEMDGNKLKVTV